MNKRKIVIDLDNETFKILSFNATSIGINLKTLIEDCLKNIADDLEESDIYSYLIQTRPDGKIFLNKQEQEEFEKWFLL